MHGNDGLLAGKSVLEIIIIIYQKKNLLSLLG